MRVIGILGKGEYFTRGYTRHRWFVYVVNIDGLGGGYIMQDLYIILVGAAALVAGWFTAIQSGKKQERNAQAQQTLSEVRKAQEKVRYVKDKVDKMDDDAVRDHAASRLRADNKTKR